MGARGVTKIYGMRSSKSMATREQSLSHKGCLSTYNKKLNKGLAGELVEAFCLGDAPFVPSGLQQHAVSIAAV